MRFRRHIKKTKFAFSCIVLFGYAAYTAYALYYFLAFESPLGIALLALVGATLALTAVITFISYRVNLKDRPRPRIQRLIKIVKLTIQLAATALTVIFFVTAARQHSALPWIVSGISAAILLLSLSVNVIAAAIARGLRLALSHRRAAKNEWLHLRLSLEETLMLGLQFLMAADIIGTISNPDLQGVIVLTVIVLLRVVLSFTLSREVAEMDRREREAESRAPSDEKHDADEPR